MYHIGTTYARIKEIGMLCKLLIAIGIIMFPFQQRLNA
jgi:hypothetical protein